MRSIVISKEKLTTIVLQAYQQGFNNRDQWDKNPCKIHLGSQNNGKEKSYFVIVDDIYGNMTFENCPQIDSKSIDCFDLSSKDGLGMTITILDDLTNNLKGKLLTGDQIKSAFAEKLYEEENEKKVQLKSEKIG